MPTSKDSADTADSADQTRSAPRQFTLWREVLAAYAAPAISAGAAGAITGQSDLALAACTSIAGTSALVAFAVGSWLRRGGRPRRWTTTLQPVALTVLLTGVTTATAAALGRLAATWLPAHTLLPEADWLDRLQIDLPVSAALATTIVTLRWRAAVRRQHA